MVVEAGDNVILIDPMLGPTGTMPPFSFIRSKPRRNPIVPLPESCHAVLERVTHCLITHKHPDHLDVQGEHYLVEKQIPVSCSVLDEELFRKKGFNVVQPLDYWKEEEFLGGKIVGTPARHGYGYVAKPAGNVMGFYFELPDEPSVYLSSDTIYTEDVKKVLNEFKPGISVVASGTARFDLFKPLLMTLDDVIRFTRDAPGKVIANHLEAVNHCTTDRAKLKQRLQAEGLTDKTMVPDDGDWMTVSS